jgi:hypothetical protein
MLLSTVTPAFAGIGVEAGLTGSHSSSAGDVGGGSYFQAAWWFRTSFAVAFTSQEQYSSRGEVLTHLGVGANAMYRLGYLGLRGNLSLVHQHEELPSQVKAHPLSSLFGVGIGTHHRAGASVAVDLIVPFRQRGNHEWYAAIGADATVFGDDYSARFQFAGHLALGIVFEGRALP